MNDLDGKIVIIKDEEKQDFLFLLSNKLINVKIITLNEFKNNYFFTYNKKTIKYVCEKYNIIYEIADIYLNNLYYINDIKEEKINFLIELKKDLDNNNLLIYNNEFKEFIQNSELILYDLEDIDNFYIKEFEKLNIKYYKKPYIYEKKDIYEFKNIEDEVSFVASSISDLIKHGVNINNIKLANVSENYLFTINKIFSIFNLPIEIKNNNYISGTKIIKEFKKNFENDVNNALDITKSFIQDSEDEKVYKKLLNILNDYSCVDNLYDYKEYIFHDINNTLKDNYRYDNSIKVIDFKNSIINNEDYVFLINFNEGVFPKDHKDEDYLSDKTKEKLLIDTSFIKNKKEREYITKKLHGIKNIIISYSKYDKEELYISSIYNENDFNIKKYIETFSSSNKYNMLKLTSLYDLNAKYGIINNDLISLNNKYNLKYLNYDNNYKPINKDALMNYLNNSLKLSYTSINAYYECSFKYYLKYILKLDKYESNFDSTLGNIFHEILSLCFNDNFDFEKEWESALNKLQYNFTVSEMFFLKNLKKELVSIIGIIKEQMKYISLNKKKYEHNVTIKIDEKLNITFTGFIDKILYDNFDDKTICVIIDYKTGNSDINIKNINYGLNMQLPVYIYLIKNSDEFKNSVIGGFYLQKLLKNNLNDNKNELLKLEGYSNKNEDILKYVDSNYSNSKIIKSLRKTSNDFYSYSKIISNEEIDSIYSAVDKNIINAKNNIINASFTINPKKLNNKNISCEFCEYKDICYMNNKNIVNLEPEGDTNE